MHQKSIVPGTVLIIDDEEAVRVGVSQALVSAGFLVTALATAEEAIPLVIQSPPQIILADVVLPGMSGVDLCEQIKADLKTANVPVILISGSLTDSEDQINGLVSGADDYILKPFDETLLVAKIRAVLRRYTAPNDLKDWLQVEGLTLDIKAWTVTIEGKPVYLTRKEFDLLVKLLRRRGNVLHPSFLLESVWGRCQDSDDFRTVRVHISSLRSKLGQIGSKIINIPGVGYKFDA